jgi:hypothetical protein
LIDNVIFDGSGLSFAFDNNDRADFKSFDENGIEVEVEADLGGIRLFFEVI